MCLVGQDWEAWDVILYDNVSPCCQLFSVVLVEALFHFEPRVEEDEGGWCLRGVFVRGGIWEGDGEGEDVVVGVLRRGERVLPVQVGNGERAWGGVRQKSFRRAEANDEERRD